MMETEFELLVKSMSPLTRERLVRHFKAERLKKLDSIEQAIDEVQVRRAQGAALAYKNLAKSFAE